MIKNILSGIKAYSGTFKIIANLGLWKYFWIPVLISLITATLIFTSAYALSDNIGQFLSQWWVWDWGKNTVDSLSSVVGGILIILLGFILYKHIVMALSAPFMGPVSEKIEAHLLGKRTPNPRDTIFMEQLWRGIRINLRNLSMEILLTLPIILIGLIPVIGLLSSILLFLVQGYYAGFGNMDYTLERHFKYNESINFVRRHKGAAIGNGIIFTLFLFIPVIGVIMVLPLSVTAATVKTVELLKLEKQIG
ncbi:MULTISPECIES: EI24 domain-containing protein [unclassified Arenibacter]|uniref:EI24 domain-containing protein n=1 Tax=unclassified Arenibacter TaxID=2615047 RepID=UPI000E3493B0|nr:MULTISPECIES: EI24 domain-containing protein [unclassified Arenibacter]MCM4162058.1 coproporphyrinogen III oxidase [Arenibacter sp. A80]RFT57680.1 coproporphyrinogen III oxidase [Arenibacter sp. P308M17]